MKRILIYFLAILVFFAGFILGIQRKETPKIHPIVKKLFQYLEIRNCSIIKMPSLKKNSVILEDDEISDFKIKEIKNQIMEDLIKKSDFEMNQDVVAQYAMGSVYAYEEEARMKGVSLDEYIKCDLNLNKEDFYEMCYEEGKALIQSYLVIGAIAEKEGITVSENDINEFEEGDQTYSDEDKIYISYQFLEDKVYQLFFENVKMEAVTY